MNSNSIQLTNIDEVIVQNTQKNAAVWKFNLLLFDYGWQIFVVNQLI